MPDRVYNRPHLFMAGRGIEESYTSPKQGRSVRVPLAADREAQYQLVSSAYALAISTARSKRNASDVSFSGVIGTHIDIDVPSEVFSAERYDFHQQQIDLITVKRLPSQLVQVTLFVPQIKELALPKKFQRYRTELGRGGKPKNHSLVDSITGIHESSVRSLWTDAPERFPKDNEMIWWEVWLRATRSANFLNVANQVGIEFMDSRLLFPLAEVLYARASLAEMDLAFRSCDALAELRAAQNSPAPWVSGGPVSDVATLQNFAAQLQSPPSDAPVVCVIDSGVNRGHPVIAPALDPADMHHTSGPGASDYEGHGTGMAALALHGDLAYALAQTGSVELSHRLESVAFLHPATPPSTASSTPFPQLVATETTRAVSLVETQAPMRSRVHCIAITLVNPPFETGRPTANSANIDQLSSDPLRRRLFCISAGNVRHSAHGNYPTENDLAGIEDPAQSWNALTIGAYTDLDSIQNPSFINWTVLAPKGDLSPFSRTGVSWSRQWPNKPDVVFEGGNLIHAPGTGSGAIHAPPELQLITADRGYPNPPLRTFGATSGATALASRFSAQLIAREPERWPETIRGLVVHSADWTPAMQSQVSSELRTDTLLRRYGYGVPNFDRASRSANDDCTMMFEREITPFRLDGYVVKTNELVLHEIPWPAATLLALGSKKVFLRITLSYFVEPSPGEKGYAKRYRYASHGLRFALIGENEQRSDFRARINREAQGEPGDLATSSSTGRRAPDRWRFGPARDRGSIHSDILELTAAQISSRRCVAVYPIASGWWRELKRQNRYSSRTRYSLIVSIRFAEHISTDIYAELKTQIAVETSVRST